MKNLLIINCLIILSTYSSGQGTRVSIKQTLRNENMIRNQHSLITKNDPMSGFAEYAEGVKKEIYLNDKSISNLKISLMCEQINSIRKFRKKVTSLEIENNELKSELKEYIEYGAGNWKTFKREFNFDLAMVKQDLLVLTNNFVTDELLAENHK